MASLGFPVIAFEPVRQHVETIQGSIDVNPTFTIDLHHSGVSYSERKIKANFGHGARNWGASEFHEVGTNETFEEELSLHTLDRIVGAKKVVLLKIDCEGCEYEALKGAKKLLKRVSMIKIELVQPSCKPHVLMPAAVLCSVCSWVSAVLCTVGARLAHSAMSALPFCLCFW